MTLLKSPFCQLCGHERPAHKHDTDCVPCANTGHNGRLIETDDDLYRSLAIKAKHFINLEFTSVQRNAVPAYIAAVKRVPNAKLSAILLGHCVVVSASDLDEIEAMGDIGMMVRTCHNKRQLGVRDAFVAWIYEHPTDLVRCDNGFCRGSGRYMSEIKPGE